MKIISYKKHTDKLVTRTLLLPSDKQGQFIGTELATLSDGLTYVSMPVSATLPTQPKEIAKSITDGVVLTAAQAIEIKSKSPHIRLINERVGEKIRADYAPSDETKLTRIAIGALQKTYTPTPAERAEITAYQSAVEAALAWGRSEKAKLGL